MVCSIPNCGMKVQSRGLCTKHYTRLLRYGDPLGWAEGRGLTVEERFWRKVDIRPDHWLWTGNCTPNGYGKFSWREDGKIISVGAHVFAYRLLVGPIPEDRPYLDHVVERCQRKDCCWPAHLEPVTPAENNRRHYIRQTHCVNNHEFTPKNTKIVKGSQRVCRQCGRDRGKAYRERQKHL